MICLEKRICAGDLSFQLPYSLNGKVSAWQRRIRRPGSRLDTLRQKRLQPIDHFFCEAAVGGDLAAEDRDNGRGTRRRIELQHIVARCSLRVAGPVIVERADASIAPNHVWSVDGVFEALRDSPTKIVHLFRGRRGLAGIALKITVGRAD